MRIQKLALASLLASLSLAQECNPSPFDEITQLETVNRCAGVICMDNAQCSTLFCNGTVGVCSESEVVDSTGTSNAPRMSPATEQKKFQLSAYYCYYTPSYGYNYYYNSYYISYYYQYCYYTYDYYYSGGLSGGAIAGIVIGAFTVLVACISCCVKAS